MIRDKKSQWHRVKLLALIAVFLSPFVGGWLALYVFELRPESKNYGSLVQPPLKVKWPVLNSLSGEQYSDGFGKKWTFLMFTRATCTEQCRSNLYYMRQIRTLLGRNTRRLQNVLISAVPIGAELKALLLDYPSLVVIDNFDNEALYSQFQAADMEGVIDSSALPGRPGSKLHDALPGSERSESDSEGYSKVDEAVADRIIKDGIIKNWII